MVAFADAGITTFDCADIYTGVEELIGRFRLRYRDVRGDDALARIKVHTKFVPDLDMLKRINKSYVEGVIDQSLAAAEARPARPRAVPLVGLCRAAMARNGAVAERAQAVRQDPQGERHQLRHRPHAAHGQCRRAADLDAGAVFAARFPAGQAHGRGGRGKRRRAVLLRHGGRRLPRRPLARPAGAAGSSRTAR